MPTAPLSSERIQAKTLHDVTRYIGVDPVFIDERIRQLEREWDIARTLEAQAGITILAGVALGFTVDRRFLALPLLAAGCLVQQALTGWNPTMPLMRRFGMRTAAEIHQEMIALKIMRGDFLERTEYPERALAGARTWA